MIHFTLLYKCLNCGQLVRLSETCVRKKFYQGEATTMYNFFKTNANKVEFHNCYGNPENFGLVKLVNVQFKGETSEPREDEETKQNAPEAQPH